MSSILTNNGAMVALETLRNINKGLTNVQSEISTGKKVNSAKDNAAVWSISTVMSSDVDSFKQINDSLNLGSSTVGVARAASEKVTEMLTDMKALIVSAQEENVDRSKIQTDISALRDQIGSIVSAAQFNGQNLIDGTSSTDMKILSSLDRDGSGVTAATIDVARQDLSLSGTVTPASVGSADTTTNIMQNGAAASGTTVAVANGATQVIQVKQVSSGHGFSITLDDSAGANNFGAQTVTYVADAGDSLEDIASYLTDALGDKLGSGSGISLSYAAGSISIVNGTGAAVDMTANASTGGTPETATGGLSGITAIDVTSDASGALTAIEGLISTAVDAAAAFGSAQTRIENQSEFVNTLSDAMTSGIGTLVDADMEAASAKLQALQVQQQLGTQALSIANQAPQSLLSLFR